MQVIRTAGYQVKGQKAEDRRQTGREYRGKDEGGKMIDCFLFFLFFSQPILEVFG